MFSILQKYFGFSQFRPLQQQIIECILQQKDAFVLMPTGGGKSLCYQLPSIMMEGVTVVVSPLISLMKDQVDSLIEMGVRAAHINSSLSAQEIQDVRGGLNDGKIDLLYVAPERLMMAGFFEYIKQRPVSLFAIDEAHCISEWGHDFRPEYRQLSVLKNHFPNIPIVALTATATPVVQKDIINQLHLNQPQKFQASFNRENLNYQVIPKSNTYERLHDYLAAHRNDSGIIYCMSRRSVEALAERLRADGFLALPYHAGLAKDERSKNQERFIKDDVQIIVATIAFGMGIDKPNVRFVIHYDLPKNLEGYYQETGRAGRDGLPSDCILFYSYGDRMKIEYFINEKQDQKERQIAYEKLDQMTQYCESQLCRRTILLNYFGEEYQQTNCSHCDNCQSSRQQFDGTVAAQKLLSCVARVHERFGTNYVIDVLRGSAAERIIHNGHANLSTHGIGKEHSKSEWQTIIRELIQLGYLAQIRDPFPVLKLTAKSHDILFNNKKVVLTKYEEPELPSAPAPVGDMSRLLFDRLRTLRKRIADEEHIPPYIVFPDNTLTEMATLLPGSWDALRMITGVGETKLKKYGPRFLREIVRYCQESDIEPKTFIRKYRTVPRKTRTPTEHITLQLLQQGLSLREVANERKLTVKTIVGHLEKLILKGENIILDKYIPIEKQRVIRKVLIQLDTEFLTPVKKRLGDGFSFEEIRLVRAKLLVDR